MATLTKRCIDAARPRDKRYILWDDDLSGFGLLVLPSGVRSFIVDYRNGSGRKRRLSLGRYGVLTPDQARKDARAILVDVARGSDPSSERRIRREGRTVNELMDRYLSEHVDKHNARTTAEIVHLIVNRHIRPRLGRLKVDGVTRQDIIKLHRSRAETPRSANHTLSILSKAFALAETWGLRPEHSNPVRGVPRYKEVERERFLSGEELARLGQALIEAETTGVPWRIQAQGQTRKHLARPQNRHTRIAAPIVAAVRLLLFTGARLSEILELKWDHVDMSAGTLALPSRKGRGRRAHPVSTGALEVLANLPRIEGSDHVLPKPDDPSDHITKSVMQNAWRRIRSHAALDDVRLHDLRHTVGTNASQAGGNAFLISHVLRHSTLAVTGRYVNPDADPIREISNAVGDRIAAGLAGKDYRDNVVPLRERRTKRR